MTDTFPRLAFLGAGAMLGAIINGILASGAATTGSIIATNRSVSSAQKLAFPGVESISLETDPQANQKAAASADLLVIGVKPTMVPALLREIAPVINPDAVVVSVAAGVALDTYQRELGAAARVVRLMPNTPALVGAAVTGMASGKSVTENDRALVRRLCQSVGTVVEVEESQIDALSTISGSGPAYVYLLIEEFTKAAQAKGFSRPVARQLVEDTFSGAVKLLAASGAEPAELRRQVTSPNGTTQEAVAVLQGAGLAEIFGRATDAALARAAELATEAAAL